MLAIVLDVFSRRFPAFAGTGWAMAGRLRTGLVLDALDRAVEQRCPDSVIHHSDRERGVAQGTSGAGQEGTVGMNKEDWGERRPMPLAQVGACQVDARYVVVDDEGGVVGGASFKTVASATAAARKMARPKRQEWDAGLPGCPLPDGPTAA